MPICRKYFGMFRRIFSCAFVKDMIYIIRTLIKNYISNKKVKNLRFLSKAFFVG